MKKYLVADNVHYPIEVTKLEKLFLATPILNRLHRIKQNSTAYLTFPSANHSRFAHSLGVMHIAGAMYRHGVSNATKRAVTELVSGLQLVNAAAASGFGSNIKSWGKAKSLQGLGKIPVASTLSKDFKWARPSAAFLGLAHPSITFDSHEQWLLALGYQAVRLAALTHDLGHPPFSHVMENAMKSALASSAQRTLEGAPLPPNYVVEIASFANINSVELHEVLTRVLFCELADEIRIQLDTVFPETKQGKQEVFFNLQALELCKLLLFSEEGKTGREDEPSRACICLKADGESFAAENTHDVLLTCYNKNDADIKKAQITVRALHDIKAAQHIDADRLDYVIRDITQAGLKAHGLRLGRLLETYTLVDSVKEKLRFLPSITAIRSIEEFFSDRQELYRGVIYHHHVVKTDFLLELSINQLLLTDIVKKKQLPGKSNSSKAPSPSDFTKSISLAWKVFLPNGTDRDVHISADTRQSIYPSFDDGWLQGMLQQEYLRLSSLDGGAKQPIDFARLEELLSGKKRYISLIKRFSDLTSVADGYIEYWKSNSREVKVTANQITTMLASEIAKAKDAIKNVNGGDPLLGEAYASSLCSQLEEWEQVKEFLAKVTLGNEQGNQNKVDIAQVVHISKLYLHEQVSILSKSKSDFSALAVAQLEKPAQIIDVIARFRKPITKATIEFSVATSADDETISFGKVCNHLEGLHTSAYSIPRLFLYCCVKTSLARDNVGLNDNERKKIRKEFGAKLALVQVNILKLTLAKASELIAQAATKRQIS